MGARSVGGFETWLVFEEILKLNDWKFRGRCISWVWMLVRYDL